ncbi:helix-turn-helix domain-containing protein [Enterococcus sp.]|uniref:helix-turn-helix domain-containing protein n=1 Tax=Enterococcus sp. TaxID=35783 RepID=UPI0025B848AE|nr:helix-turn-helix domain-containing protein [Enterococcus sp.]
MNLMQLLEKNQQVHFQILTIFFQQGSEISYKTLANTLSISSPTLQKELQQLGENLSAFHSKASLEIKENDRLRLILPLDFSIQHFFYEYLSKAVDFQIIEYLFFHREGSTTKLMMDLMLSEASLFRHFKTINHLLEEFQLQMKNKKLIGDERQIRFFFYSFFSQSYPLAKIEQTFRNPAIRNVIHVIEQQLDIAIDPLNRWKMVLWLGLMEARFDFRSSQQHGASKELLKQLETDPTFQTLRNILGRYLSRFALSWSDYEAVYLYLFLIMEGLLVIDSSDESSSEFMLELTRASQTLIQTFSDDTPDISLHYPEISSFLVIIILKARYLTGALTSFADFPPHFLRGAAMMEAANLAVEQLAQGMAPFSDEKRRKLTHDLSFVIEWLQENQQKEMKIGVLLSQNRLRADVLRRFLTKQLSGYPYMKVEAAQETVYDLLIVDQPQIAENYRYQKLLILTGVIDRFEEQRLHQVIAEIRRENLESELEKL